MRSAVEIRGARVELWYTLRGAVPVPRAEAFAAALLLPAMALGLALELEAPLSAPFLAGLGAIQEILTTWVPTLAAVPIEAEHALALPIEARQTATFFTGGVDSFHTLLTRRADIAAAVFVHGLDTPLADTPLRREISARLGAAAAALGVELLEVDTNLRDPDLLRVTEPVRFSPTLYNFELGHGAALASVGHILPDRFARVFIPASTTYDDLFPWGSHPLLDPLWSSEQRSFVHHGCAYRRLAKVRAISRNDVVLRTLRVCSLAAGDRYNCCRCEKCLRTMVSLRIAGALDRCETFPERLDLVRVALIPSDERSRPYLRENLQAAEADGSDPDLARALRVALHPRGLQHRTLDFALSAWKAAKTVVPLERAHGRLVRRIDG